MADLFTENFRHFRRIHHHVTVDELKADMLSVKKVVEKIWREFLLLRHNTKF